jgi:predicted nucleotidyltransferase
MDRIADNLLESIKQRVVNEIHPRRLYLFGSHAWGKPGRDSDLDLCIVVSRLDGTRHDMLTRAYRCIRDLRVPAEFVIRTEDEMTRFSGVCASLARKVSEKGLLLYG